MTRSFLKATTALTVSLSLMNPGVLAAQGFVAVPQAKPGVTQRAPLAAPLWQVQEATEAEPVPCVEGSTDEECLTAPDPLAVPVEPAPEAIQEAVPEIVPEVIEPAPAEPEVTPEAPAPEAVEPAPAEPEAVAPEAPAPEAVEPAPAEPEATATEAPAPEAPAPEAVEPAPAEPEAAEPEVAEPETAEPQAAEPEAAAPEAVAPAPAEPEAPAETVEPEAEAPEAAPAEAAPEPAEAAPEAAPEAVEPEAPAPEAPVEPAPETTGEAPAEAAPAPVAEDAPVPDPVVEPTPEQAQALETMMADPEVAAAVETLSQTADPAAPTAEGAAAPVAGALSALGAMETGATPPPPAASTTQTIGAAESRSSTQDFTSALQTTAPTQVEDDDDGLSDLEKAGLLALGAVAVGMLINNNRVVANSGDRVVVDRGNGDLAIWKDDNAILRQPGVVETTQRFNDGSTLTTMDRADGSQIITVRDATGRVVRRNRVDPDGRIIPIIDDTRPYRPVEVSQLPRPRVQELRFTDDTDPAFIRSLLEEAEQADIGRTFSLSQVRQIRELRELAPELTGNPITFATGSSAIRPDEAGKLSRLAQLMRDMLQDNPRELFLIEGHTDAVGSAAYNLALSDRRAESVALALTEIFGVPAENMVVQGYGERYLKVRTLTDEPANRRVALRRITWLIDES